MDLLHDPANLTPDQLENGDRFAPRFDPDGLILAIASQADTGQVLMAAYMNREALQRTIETGQVHYYSRSRKKLWKKGESSGEIQKLRTLRTDCDQDVLLLEVEQTGRGAACHTGHKSCFYRKLEMSDDGFRLTDDTTGPLFDPKEVYGR